MLCKGLIFTEDREVFFNRVYHRVGIWRPINIIVCWSCGRREFTAHTKKTNSKLWKVELVWKFSVLSQKKKPKYFSPTTLVFFKNKQTSETLSQNQMLVECFGTSWDVGYHGSRFSALWFYKDIRCEIIQFFWNHFMCTEELVYPPLWLVI